MEKLQSGHLTGGLVFPGMRAKALADKQTKIPFLGFLYVTFYVEFLGTLTDLYEVQMPYETTSLPWLASSLAPSSSYFSLSPVRKWPTLKRKAQPRPR